MHCLAFAHAATGDTEIHDIGDGSDSDAEQGGVPRHRWLASGGKDCRVALWALMDFSSSR